MNKVKLCLAFLIALLLNYPLYASPLAEASNTSTANDNKKSLACSEDDSWMGRRPFNSSWLGSDPREGHYARVNFQPAGAALWRLVVKHRIGNDSSRDQLVARFYGATTGGAREAYYLSPGGELLFQFAECVNGNWSIPLAQPSEVPVAAGNNTRYVVRAIGYAGTASFTIEFGPDVRPPDTPGGAQPFIHAERTTPATTRFQDAYFVMQHNTYAHEDDMGRYLDRGLRALEIDILDAGDWQSQPDGPVVKHDPLGSGSGKRLGAYLREITNWMTAHPGQGPILVFVDFKASDDPFGDWSGDEIDRVDKVNFQILGNRMYTADKLYRQATGGAYTPGGKTLRQAVSESGWSTLSSMSDQVVVAYTGGKFGQRGVANGSLGTGIEYIISHGRPLPYGFFCPEVEINPEELAPGKAVKGMSVSTSQYIVAANLSVQDHYQVTANAAYRYKQILHLYGDNKLGNGSFAFNYIAVAHGVSAIGRDTNTDNTYGGAIPLVGVRRSVPGYFTVEPLNASGKVMEVKDAGTNNGANVQLAASTGEPKQSFVYTAEGQLRPKHSNKNCIDIEGADAEDNAKIHLWRCSGGDHVKWAITPEGALVSVDNPDYVLTVKGAGTSAGTGFVTAKGREKHQRFKLNAVVEWNQTEF
ncbi:MAG TPA: RICIN domain-containing protein [Pyrinomonadaceae bacterium]